jgi:hypothetical protein
VEAAARKKPSRASAIRSRPLRLADLIDMAASDPNELKRRLATVMTAMKGEDEQSADTAQAGERDSCSRIVRLILTASRRCLICVCRIAASLIERNSKTGQSLRCLSHAKRSRGVALFGGSAACSPPTAGHDD